MKDETAKPATAVDAKKKTIHVRLSEREYLALVKKAARARKRLSSWIRERLTT